MRNSEGQHYAATAIVVAFVLFALVEPSGSLALERTRRKGVAGRGIQSAAKTPGAGRVAGRIEYPNIVFKSHTQPHWDGVTQKSRRSEPRLRSSNINASGGWDPTFVHASNPLISRSKTACVAGPDGALVASPTQIVSPRDAASGLPTGKTRKDR